MGLHARKPERRTLLRAGLTLTALGAALGAGAGSAGAVQLPSVADAPDQGVSALQAVGETAAPAVTSALGTSLAHSVAPVTDLQLDPLANTGVDPLDNAVGTQIADFKPVTTAIVTDPITSGASLSELPVVGAVTGLVTR
ncbi:hypothetical protein ADK88_05285 [Streptomyces sp. NRRL F-2295]|uniref:hypothetical protein n=1 Tax=Streptomyces sp. NRRL F-2295 TaxID=1519477 RepID=UPI0006AE2C5A|nr:hypothetical protein [Streptomyces sp. NRRL F-2295]KOU09772.1 hypothetical protein ADK88_05285 [Streptomyces sp. NRRL F-2295]